MDQELITFSSQIGQILKEKNLTISVAESCTGGLLSHVLTGVSGASDYFIGGVVAYSNYIKERILGVKHQTLLNHGAVSEETALEMASGIKEKFGTDIGLSTTGIAGPTGGTPTKPVGLVWMGISTPEDSWAFNQHFKGSRTDVQALSVLEILSMLLENLK